MQQRVIKFRAWSEELKKFCNNSEWVLDHEDGLTSGFFDADIESHKLTLQQFTGLKDAKGKEIYEGDIVACNPNKKFYRHVAYSENNAEWYFVAIESRGIPDADCIPAGVMTTSHTDTIVCGNIYENPELLREGV